MTDVKVVNLRVEYRDGGQVITPVDGFSMSAMSGELVLLMGPSGSGKTSLLSCLAGILSPARGDIWVNGVDVVRLDEAAATAYRRHDVGMVFQAFNLVASLSALENVAVPLLAAGSDRRAARARATALLEDVGLDGQLARRPGELSGGQQQRVAIARALAHDPAVILADEPTAHLDHAAAEGVLRILRRLTAEGRVVIVATHDHRLVPVADAVIDLTPSAGAKTSVTRVVQLAPDEELFSEGDPSDLVWIVRSGEIVIDRVNGSGNELLATCGVGSYFGELGPLLGFPRSASARASSGGAAVEGFDVQRFREIVGDDVPESWGSLAVR